MLTDFPGKLWLDVLSKADLLESDFKAADAAGDTQTAPENSASMQEQQQETMQAQTVADGQQTGATAGQHAGSNLQHQQPIDGNPEVHNSAQPAEQVSRATDARVSGDQQSSETQIWMPDASRGVLAHQQADDTQTLHMAHETLSSSHQQQSGCDEQAANVKASASLSHASLSVAAQAALILPDAIRISSVTQSGIQQLQVSVTNLLAKHLEAREP